MILDNSILNVRGCRVLYMTLKIINFQLTILVMTSEKSDRFLKRVDLNNL